MLKLVEWSPELDLSSFYEEANRRGFENNSSQKRMIDTFKKEKEWKAWIIYYNDIAVASTAAHSFDIMGSESYRIAVRSCVFSDMMPRRGLLTLNNIITLQNFTSQVFMTTGIEWAGKDKKFYITTNENESGSQRRVHRTWATTLEKTKVLTKEKDIIYRSNRQTPWRVNVEEFYKQLDKYGRWSFERG